MVPAEKFNAMHSTQPPLFEILMGIDLNPKSYSSLKVARLIVGYLFMSAGG